MHATGYIMCVCMCVCLMCACVCVGGWLLMNGLEVSSLMDESGLARVSE